MEEIAGVRPKWDYFKPRIEPQQCVKETPKPKIYGQKFYVNRGQGARQLWMEDPTSPFFLPFQLMFAYPTISF